MKAGQPGVPTLHAWAAEHLPLDSRLGIDPYVHSVDEATTLEKALEQAGRNLSLVPLHGQPNLVDLVWAHPPEGSGAHSSRATDPSRAAPAALTHKGGCPGDGGTSSVTAVTQRRHGGYTTAVTRPAARQRAAPAR